MLRKDVVVSLSRQRKPWNVVRSSRWVDDGFITQQQNLEIEGSLWGAVSTMQKAVVKFVLDAKGEE